MKSPADERWVGRTIVEAPADMCLKGIGRAQRRIYSTVTDLARFLG
jgi:hypothetical protein